MAKLTKEELNAKIDSLSIDDDTKIELMEDISDSVDAPVDTTEIDTLKSEIESKDAEITDLKRKYKERFLESDTDEVEEVEDDVPDTKEVIDVKEI